MGTLLKVVGIVWALLGVGNLTMMPWAESSEGTITIGLMINMLFFVLPGLVVYGIGSGISKRKAASVESSLPAPEGHASPQSIEERLKALQALKDKALINDDEYQTRRSAILEEV